MKNSNEILLRLQFLIADQILGIQNKEFENPNHSVYTDIVNLVTNFFKSMKWKKPEELTKYDYPVICWTKNKQIICFKNNIGHRCGVPDSDEINKTNWKNRVEKYNIILFCYQCELDPEIYDLEIIT